jgi:DNA-binding response OmpR family regulator
MHDEDPLRQVVIIEDEPDVANLLARRFAGEGFRVATASDGRAGLHAVHMYHPHLVILDLLLPIMSGWDVCQSLKANLATQDIPVIILSAIGGAQDRIALLEMGVDDFIVKPCSVKEVVARSRTVLKRSEQGKKFPQGREMIDDEDWDHPDRG